MRYLRATTALRAATLLCVAALVALLGWSAGARAAEAPSMGGFSVHPLESEPGNPATRAYFIRRVRAGGSFTAHVVVVNNGPKPLELYVYPVDGLTGTTSGVVYADRADPKRKAGTWVQIPMKSVQVAEYSRVVVPFTVKVPRHASPGDHLAGIAVQNAATSASGGHFSVTQVIRDVVGVEMTVSGRASERIAVGHISLHALPGTNYPAVTIPLDNIGRKLCKPNLNVWLAGPHWSHWLSRQLDTVLPGSSIPYPFPWPKALGSAHYRVTVVASECGRPVTVNATTTLGTPLKRTLTSSVTPLARPGSSSSGKTWILILVGIGGLGLGIGFSRRSFHRAH